MLSEDAKYQISVRRLLMDKYRNLGDAVRKNYAINEETYENERKNLDDED